MAVAIIGRPSWPYRPARAHLLLGAARLARRRIQLADTWTYVTAAYFGVWIVVILLGL
jgi:hypothetical protein